ncbi:Phosphoinositide phospholipase C [Mycena chlorophos]|uniref:Phosphoinositide phospholipase C n=1 Tax=Mycena chlorophos TaxID=658473 RepID=A0A8H6S429_MYCCL|nr:Phosphoinositide phospholipase C [Mycena chlorophos]
MSHQASPSTRHRIGSSIRRRLGRITARSRSPSSTRVSQEVDEDVVPQALVDGIQMTKISAKKQRKLFFRLDPEHGQLAWESKIHKYIPVDAIRELRVGAETKTYRDQFQMGQDVEDRWLTIIYVVDSSYKTMHLLGPSQEVMEMFVAGLLKMHSLWTELLDGPSQGDRIWEAHFWNGRGFEFADVERLCKRLKANYDESELRRWFVQSDSNNTGILDLEDFRKFVKLFKARPDVERIYRRIVQRHERFDFTTFQAFMKDDQRSSLGLPQLKAIFEFYTDDPAPSRLLPADPVNMSLEAFTAFLHSPDNPAFADPEEPHETHKHHHHHRHHKERHPRQLGIFTDDMTRPLSEYFISSSHNTYLSGRQLVGESTIEGYIRALQTGCRCVELDIHPGHPAPVVTHGNTFTSKLPLRAVCEAIDQYAFVASPYPLVLSLEIHCSAAQQDQIVEIMTSVFGDKLMRAPVDGRPPFDALPSPEDLRGMILVKTKNAYISSSDGSLSPTSFDASFTSADSTEESEMSSLAIPSPLAESRHSRMLHKASAAMKRVRSRSRHSTGHSTQSSESLPPSSYVSLPPPSPSESLKPKMSAELLTLLVYTMGVKYRGINKKEEYAPEHLFSLSEKTANKLISFSAVDLIKHTRTHLVRLYPKGTRLNSSNYFPHNYWSAGVQLVALNWQTVDLGYAMNHAMFQRNGGSGYVLKPLPLRLASHKDQLSEFAEYALDLEIISAQQLPLAKDNASADTFVEVSLHVPDWSGFSDSSRGTLPRSPTPPHHLSSGTSLVAHTSIVKNNGFNPVYDAKFMIPFTCVGRMLDLVFVRFAVRHAGGSADDGPPLAIYCTSLACLQQGYRHLPLHDAQLSQFMFSSLFVKVGLREA